ncbi:MAG: hypothetical protein WC548_02265 [Candidatus Pacearchaeota archaeon]
MKKLVGYIISILGLVVLVIGVGLIKFNLGILSTVNNSYILGAGIVLVIIGVVLASKESGFKKEKEIEEIPIFEGMGKKRKIVGYRRE